MDLILLRHGNTFEAGARVFWVGCRQDLPLTEAGRLQAEECARALAETQRNISGVFCGPLRRTSEYAGILVSRLSLSSSPAADQRLNELDYGGWSGLTKNEVLEKFGGEELEAWEHGCVWPSRAGWGGSESQVSAEVAQFARDVTAGRGEDETVVAVSSNGRLRYFLKLAAGEFERCVQVRNFSVKTGNVCCLRFEDGVFSVRYWNLTPAEVRAKMGT